MRTMYNECKLIHSDLSEYNILWHYNKCFFIDVSQSIEPVHPQAFHFLLRDCHNITSFFTKAGLTDMVMKEEDLFKYLCGKELGTTSLDQLEKEVRTSYLDICHKISIVIEKQYSFKLTQKSSIPLLKDSA